ncbi:hypothetical protein FUT79_08245 [Treponema phagedenis]|uniref:hypothetical protein n=1 Tax=Treponema phagedenis TaxID=162 RepID=UPI0011E768B0|nr:hypothetical protein [Treponema phagedenis]QEJ94652.1 hypothetical protein FUT79_05170 [Treponema phagedenis]QEJ95188.1 hypothetical protein FUT79_08245 [Treponema phagedenis]QKS91948.1 hypothetical protein HPJ96_04820 [Treponema phagedenis]QKS92422.1 hypothetical protein HPJ96_07630 [Treponema phagedenis]
MEKAAGIPPIGWGVILVIAFLIFIVIMMKGIRFGMGDKSLSIGKMDEKIEDIKQDIELKEKEAERKTAMVMHDEELRKSLFKKSMDIDAHLTADLRRSVRRMDEKITTIFEPFIHCPFPSISTINIIKDELNERLDYNNMREKLSGDERRAYLNDILKDIRDAYSTFLLRISKVSCGEKYPEWAEIKKPLEQLISEWEDEVIGLFIKHIEEKIRMYEMSKRYFKTDEYIENSISYPIEKNKKYLSKLKNVSVKGSEGGVNELR